jgi:hypothetical protein
MVIKFSCSSVAETNITHAIQCIPLNEIDEMNFLFVCIDSSDARRLVMENYQNFEIVIISEFVVPRTWRTEDEWSKRYFNFVVLHEVAHALLQHKSPNQITLDENSTQENDADVLAMRWLNEYFQHKKMAQFTEQELDIAQKKIRTERAKYL